MISGIAFSKLYSSLWRDVAPTTDLFVRRINLSQYERVFPESIMPTAPRRRGFVNEVAFAMFCDSIRNRNRWPVSIPTIDAVQGASATVRSSSVHKEDGKQSNIQGELTDDEIADIRQQYGRMMRTFTGENLENNTGTKFSWMRNRRYVRR
jgi:hypothetical protein